MIPKQAPQRPTHIALFSLYKGYIHVQLPSGLTLAVAQLYLYHIARTMLPFTPAWQIRHTESRPHATLDTS